MEIARRYGEVARLLADTGLIVVSTTNPFGLAYAEAAQAIRTLVHPTPVISIHMSKLPEEPPANADIVFSGPADFDAATRRILDELKRRGVLAQAIGAKPTFQYSILTGFLTGFEPAAFDWLKTAVLPYHPYFPPGRRHNGH